MSVPDHTVAAFHAWLDRTVGGEIPQEISAFVLHLYEGTSTFDAQLAGTTRFDSTDSDWVLDDIWSTGEDLFGLDRTLADDSWETALDMFSALMRGYAANGLHAGRLQQAIGIAVGFVDGDVRLISERQTSRRLEPTDIVAEPGDLLDSNYVWVFNGHRNQFPSGVFATRSDAEAWIGANRLRGTLTKYPVGVSVYDWAIRRGVFIPKKATHSSADFIANFSSGSQEHIHFEPDEQS